MTRFGLTLGLLGLGLVAAGPPSPVVRHDRARIAAQRLQADGEVRLALEAEAEGRQAAREEHLRRALELSPSDPTALGLLGLVAERGRPERPGAAALRAQADADLAAALAEYNTRRAGVRQSVDDQWALALWCEGRGLQAEAMAHFTAVTRLDPDHRAAWKRLGYRFANGRWMTDAQIAEERGDQAARAAADRTWRPRLASLKKGLRDDLRHDEAKRELDRIHDPRAVPAIWALLGQGAATDQAWAVRVLGHIDAPEAAQDLARLTVDGGSSPIRRAAVDRLRHFDPGIFVGWLINRLADPIHFEVRPVLGPQWPGELWVEGPEFNVRWLYAVQPGFGVDAPRGGPGFLPTAGRRGPVVRQAGLRADGVSEAQRGAIAEARQMLERDATRIDRENFLVDESNTRTLLALHTVTGHDLGPDRQGWTQWWSNQLGYTYESPKPPPVPRPTLTRMAAIVAPRTIPTPISYSFGSVHHSCFAAGTIVHAKFGLRAIETIQVGDQVLSQNTETGALAYEPVLAVFRNPPSRTLRIDVGGQTVIATPIHRFWQVGRGWTMARDLKAGDPIRALGGVARIVSVDEDQVRPVFNLEVAVNQNYLVASDGLLVHDHSLVRPADRPFDAVTRLDPQPLPVTADTSSTR